jgi:hypothetical protein
VTAIQPSMRSSWRRRCMITSSTCWRSLLSRCNVPSLYAVCTISW